VRAIEKHPKAFSHWIGRQISRKRVITFEVICVGKIKDKTLKRHGYVHHPDILIMKAVCI